MRSLVNKFNNHRDGIIYSLICALALGAGTFQVNQELGRFITEAIIYLLLFSIIVVALYEAGYNQEALQRTYFVQNEDDTWYYTMGESKFVIDYDSRKAFDKIKPTPTSPIWDYEKVPVLPFKTLEEAEEHRKTNHAEGLGNQYKYNSKIESFTRDGFYVFKLTKNGKQIEGLSNISEDLDAHDSWIKFFGKQGSEKEKSLHLCKSVEQAKEIMKELGLTQITISEVQKQPENQSAMG